MLKHLNFLVTNLTEKEVKVIWQKRLTGGPFPG